MDAGQFQVSVIPHTGEETTLLHKAVGAQVNLENDVVGKYVEKLLGIAHPEKTEESGLTMEFLREYGI